MTREEKLKHCLGCYNNDYNYGLSSAKECFSLEKAVLTERYVVHKDQMPPYSKDQCKTVLNCYQPQCFAVVEPKYIREDGYWVN